MDKKRYMVTFACVDGIFEIEAWGISDVAATFVATGKLICLVNDINDFWFKSCVETPEDD